MIGRFLRRFWLVCLAFLAVAASQPAQAQWGIYFQGTGAGLRVANTNHLYGSTFGFYDQKNAGHLTLGADFRGTLLDAGNAQGSFSDERLDYGLFGLRAAANPNRYHLMPYAEGLVGVGYFREGQGVTRQDQKSGALQAVGGVDMQIHGRWEWRVAEVTYSRLRGQLYTVNPITISSGIVIRLP